MNFDQKFISVEIAVEYFLIYMKNRVNSTYFSAVSFPELNNPS